MKELIESINIIRKYIVYIYDNEGKFIEYFELGDVMDLTRISFTGFTCDVHYILHDGTKISKFIGVFDVIDWIDGLK